MVLVQILNWFTYSTSHSESHAKVLFPDPLLFPSAGLRLWSGPPSRGRGLPTKRSSQTGGRLKLGGRGRSERQKTWRIGKAEEEGGRIKRKRRRGKGLNLNEEIVFFSFHGLLLPPPAPLQLGKGESKIRLQKEREKAACGWLSGGPF